MNESINTLSLGTDDRKLHEGGGGGGGGQSTKKKRCKGKLNETNVMHVKGVVSWQSSSF